jgi:hypothetical protein
MRYMLLVFLAVATLFSGEWIYRSFLRTVDQPTQQMIALERHFNEAGIKGNIYAVRHGYRHSELTATAAFQIEGYPLPIALEQCPTEDAAETHFRLVQGSPNLMHPQRNGLLVMNLPMWGSDTERMANKVVAAFTSLRAGI